MRCLCSAEIANQQVDDSGTSLASVHRITSIDDPLEYPASTVVIATDAAPPAESIHALLGATKGVPHVVLLSRLGASRGGLYAIGMGKWRAAEEAALAYASKDMMDVTILRCGTLLGGPYYSPDGGPSSWLGKDEAELTDAHYRAASVEVGDLAASSQPGYGTSRRIAAGAVGAAVRRGPLCGRHAAYSEYAVRSHQTSRDRRPVTTAAAWDTLFDLADEASGVLLRPPKALDDAAAEGDTTTHTRPPIVQKAMVHIDSSDERLRAFTQPAQQGTLTTAPGLSEPLWATLLLLVVGLVDSLTRSPRGWCTDNVGPNFLRGMWPALATTCAERFPDMMHMQQMREALYP